MAAENGEEAMNKKEPSAAQKMIGDFAPKLVALNRTEQLPFHIERALDNGVTKDELVEAITHLAFYTGWPNAMSAIMIAKELSSKRDVR